MKKLNTFGWIVIQVDSLLFFFSNCVSVVIILFKFKGHDDAFAIMLASHNERIELIGVSTIAGNQSIQKTTKNAMNVLNICGFVDDVPVKSDDNSFEYT